jgi:hypothetical protein
MFKDNYFIVGRMKNNVISLLCSNSTITQHWIFTLGMTVLLAHVFPECNMNCMTLWERK